MCCLSAVTHGIGVNTTEHNVFIQLLGDILKFNVISVLQAGVNRVAHFEESTDILNSKAVLEGHRGESHAKEKREAFDPHKAIVRRDNTLPARLTLEIPQHKQLS